MSQILSIDWKMRGIIAAVVLNMSLQMILNFSSLRSMLCVAEMNTKCVQCVILLSDCCQGQCYPSIWMPMPNCRNIALNDSQ